MRNLGAEHQNLDQKTYLIIKEMITKRQLLPGGKIPQEKLASELGISRTPLVNALKLLENEKLVEAKPRRGYFVRLFDVHEMISIFELREVLEGLAAKRAAGQITDQQILQIRRFFSDFSPQKNITDYKAYSRQDREFHNFVTDIGSKEFLKSILQAYNIISFSYQVVGSEGLIRSPDETIVEHLSIMEAVCDRDPEAAEEMMRRHFKRTIKYLQDNILENAPKDSQAQTLKTG
jgi:DNA-binding GntR family transcriptional regulator